MNLWPIVLILMCVVVVVFGDIFDGVREIFHKYFNMGKLAITPPGIAEIKYPSGARVYRGTEVTLDQVIKPPEIKWYIYNNSTRYTICLIEPNKDDWDNYIITGYRHWLVGNIPEDYISRGEVLSEYELGTSPGEVAGGNHTYIFLLYKQMWPLNFDGSRVDNNIDKCVGYWFSMRFPILIEC
ncbi:39S ribosomal protein L38, mitochondrial-like isoform X2 [Sipha flava]|uniref:39S ribosomal protein L38, mitochondrial-like isoform X2 n=1 Tax=Sipha flava TaxID=143950 RepID=A0A8B8GRI9_9HEMI|nr:39S ribosomal protein L38, mitochondrial-like isoform X2 [Sipha flava]